MTEEILKFTKITFVIHFVTGLIFTFLFLSPGIFGPLFVLSYTDTVGAVTMMLGAAFVGLTIGSLLAILAKEWKEIRILVLIECFWLVVSLIALTFYLNLYKPLIYVSLVLNIVLLALFALTFLQQEDKMKPLL